MESTPNWKQKYFDALEELERKEAHWTEAEAVLRRGLGRVALAYPGGDDELGRGLRRLRRVLQKNGDIDQVDDLIESISERLKVLDEDEAGFGDQADQAWQVLDRLLDRLPLSPQSRAQAAELMRRGAKSKGTAAMQQVVDDFAAMVAEAMATRGGEKPDGDGKGGGLLGRLMGRSTPGDGDDVDAFDDPLCIEDVFLDFLDCMAFPQDLAPRAQALREKLMAGVGPDDVKALTHDVVGLVVEMRTALETEKEDLEKFLQSLVERLQELDAVMDTTASDFQEARESGRAFDAAVKAQVGDISQAVDSETDLEHMKGIIHRSLANICHHLEAQRSHDEHQRVAMEQRLQGLNRRLHEMEAESQQLRQRLEAEREQALTDPLTGSPNRLAFEQRIAQEYARWRRYRSTLSLVLCDVDHFKKINDTYGHKAGDRALQGLVAVINKYLRTTDFLARVGGEEFVLILPETSCEQAMTAAEKVRASIENADFVYRGEQVHVTLSGGVAQFREGDSVDDVYQRADEALYRAKRGGRNQFKTER